MVIHKRLIIQGERQAGGSQERIEIQFTSNGVGNAQTKAEKIWALFLKGMAEETHVVEIHEKGVNAL